MAGYTGFVPRHRKFHGKVYDVSCTQAIQDYKGTAPKLIALNAITDPIPGNQLINFFVYNEFRIHWILARE